MAALFFQFIRLKNPVTLLEVPVFSPLSNPAPNPVGSPHQSPPSVTKSPTLHRSRTCIPPSQAPCFSLALPLSGGICNKEPSYPVQMSEHILGGGQWLPQKSHSPHSSMPPLCPALHPLQPHTSSLCLLRPMPTSELALQALLPLLHVRTPGFSHLPLRSSLRCHLLGPSLLGAQPTPHALSSCPCNQ